MEAAIQPHNQKPASVWNSGGARYEDISRGIAEPIWVSACRANTGSPSVSRVKIGCDPNV
jgi:hypothetical protein